MEGLFKVGWDLDCSEDNQLLNSTPLFLAIFFENRNAVNA
jgi:hypothetical protein